MGNSVLDPSLERQVLLALGWLRTAQALTPDDADRLPPEALSAPEAYLESQRDRARDALNGLEARIEALRQEIADAARILYDKRVRLIERMSAEGRSAQDINRAAATLTRQFEDHLEQARTCDRLLGMIHGEIETPAPSLPLGRYEDVYRQLGEQTDVVAEDEEDDLSGELAPEKRPLPIHVARFLLQRTDRTDRFALGIAAVLCAAVIVVGAWYILQWGHVELAIQALGENRYQLTCHNTTGHTVQLIVPYDKQGLPREPLAHFGLALDLRDNEGSDIFFPIEAVWFHKELPAHLYGPVVIGPMSRAELYLDLSGCIAEDTPYVMELTLFNAPHEKYNHYVLGHQPDLKKLAVPNPS